MHSIVGIGKKPLESILRKKVFIDYLKAERHEATSNRGMVESRSNLLSIVLLSSLFPLLAQRVMKDKTFSIAVRMMYFSHTPTNHTEYEYSC